MNNQELWVVMPVYNEQSSLPRVLDEWLPIFKEVVGQGRFVLAALNDGSKDQSLAILRAYAARYPEIRVIDKPNSGHGQSCMEGYRRALDNGAAWVFQMDSDGQCDPQFFGELWRRRNSHPVIYGYRSTRDDGFIRYGISRAVSLVTWMRTGIWVRDPNVPYRLMKGESLAPFVRKFPPDFGLANVLLAALHDKYFKIAWSNIHFRQRFGGKPSIKHLAFVKQGHHLWIQLKKMKDIHP